MKNCLKLFACVIITAAYIALLFVRPFSIAVFLLGVPVCNWLANLVHELGHLTAYFLLKLKWKRMVVSFFVFEAGKGLRFDGNRRVYEASCTCTYLPQTPYWRYRVALLSGGLLGVFTGIAAICVSPAVGNGIAAFFQCFGLVSILNAAYNLLLPFSPDRSLLRQIKTERENGA